METYRPTLFERFVLYPFFDLTGAVIHPVQTVQSFKTT
jgi:hypothetical protein